MVDWLFMIERSPGLCLENGMVGRVNFLETVVKVLKNRDVMSHFFEPLLLDCDEMLFFFPFFMKCVIG